MPNRSTLILSLLTLPLLAGCGLGGTADYTLRAPLTVRIDGNDVTLPAGTRVHQRLFKENIAVITLNGTADRAALRRAAGGEQK